MRRSTIPVLLIINLVVFYFWGRDFRFMSTHFLVSWEGLLQGRYWTLLTSVFSHNLFIHFLLNMMVLRSFGGLVESILGVPRFLFFYLGAGIFSSLCHCLVSAFLLHEPALPALGASGALSGLILLFSFLYPREKLLLFWIIPMPAMFGAVLFVGLDLWGLSAQAQGGGLPIGHGAHLGGALFGVLYYFLYWRGRFPMRQYN